VSLSLVRGSKSTQTTCEPFRTCSHPHPGLLLQARGSSVGMGWGGGISGKGPLARKRRLSLRERERNRARRVPFSSLGDPELPGSRLPQPQGGGGEPPSPSPRRLARALPAPLHARLGGETMEVVPARRRVGMPTVNASGSPRNCCGKWEGRRKMDLTSRPRRTTSILNLREAFRWLGNPRVGR
jgi:hypothetical protein